MKANKGAREFYDQLMVMRKDRLRGQNNPVSDVGKFDKARARRQALAVDVAEYLNAGGNITHLPPCGDGSGDKRAAYVNGAHRHAE